MTETAERIYALLVDANPVLDVDSIPTSLDAAPSLRVIDTRRDDMQTDTPQRIHPEVEAPRTRRRWIPAAAAAAVVLVVGAIAIVLTTSGEPDPVAAAPEDVARAAIADWTAGDVDAFFDRFAADGQIDDLPITDGGLQLDMAFYMSLEQVPEIGECTEIAEDAVRCIVSTTDGISGPLGIVTRIDWEFRVSDGEIVSLYFDVPSGQGLDIFDLIADMAAWMAANHADVFDNALRATLDRCTPEDFNFYGTWCASTRAAEEMLLLAPEFRAQYGS